MLEPESYAELLGLHLGDGHITEMARADRLRLFLDAKYSLVVNESEAILKTVLPANRVGRVVAEEGRMVVLYAYSSHLTCLSHSTAADILDLFVGVCESVGLSPRRYARHVRLNRRADVALLVEHVGLKA